jgi:hypothetical protein
MAETGATLTLRPVWLVRHREKLIQSGASMTRNPLREAEEISFEDDLEQIDVLSLADWLERIRR